MGNQGKHATKYSIGMEIQCQTISVKFVNSKLMILQYEYFTHQIRNVAV